VIIADKPTIEYLPLHRPTGSSVDESPIKTVTQFEMSHIEALGLLKVDFLGLATLSIMARACELIQERHGVELNLENIPTDDPATYELLGRGETAGVFQVEGSGMRRYLMQMKPTSLDHVIAMVALFRPGPMEFIPSYIRRMHGEEEVQFRHPSLEPIFAETYGYPVYQEQLMFAVMNLAGYSAPEADDLRKAVAKKQKEKLLKHREKFVAGAVKTGIPEDTAKAIFDDWEEFARYGFNKAHAADYGVLAVQTAYLKTHYPVEYMTAVLSVNQNATDKVALYAADCRRMGIRVAPPDVSISGWDFTIEDHPDGKSTIRFGLGAVKNVGHGPVDAVLEGRANSGPFKDINDFTHRVDLRQIGKRALECLVRVGALDRFGPRPALLQSLDYLVSVSGAHFRAAETGQMTFFGSQTGLQEEISLPRTFSEIPHREQLNWERELIGLYVSDHPLNPVMDALTDVVTHFSGQLGDANPDDKIRVAGIITRYRTHQTKNGKTMAFGVLEDLQGEIELVIFPRTWGRISGKIETDRLVLVEGRVDPQSSEPKLLVDSITFDLKVTQAITALPMPQPVAALPDVEPDLEVEETRPPETAKTDAMADSPEGVRPFEIPLSWDIAPAGEMPQQPEIFPPDWEMANAVMAAVADPLAAIELAEATLEPEPQESVAQSDREAYSPSPILVVETEAPKSPGAGSPGALKPEVATEPRTDQDLPPEAVQDFPPYILPPVAVAEGGSVHMITVILRPSLDKVRDNLRIRQIYGTLIAFPGNDRFAFHVFERGRGYLIEFPNFTTNMCPELLTRLKGFIPADQLRVEPITFQ
jgi:DNA polymerase-3 subunit alpha